MALELPKTVRHRVFLRVIFIIDTPIKILDSQITALEAELERYSNLKIRLYSFGIVWENQTNLIAAKSSVWHWFA